MTIFHRVRQVAQLAFYEEIKRYEKLETVEERRAAAREIYDNYIMRELLSHTHVSGPVPHRQLIDQR